MLTYYGRAKVIFSFRSYKHFSLDTSTWFWGILKTGQVEICSNYSFYIHQVVGVFEYWVSDMIIEELIKKHMTKIHLLWIEDFILDFQPIYWIFFLSPLVGSCSPLPNPFYYLLFSEVIIGKIPRTGLQLSLKQSRPHTMALRAWVLMASLRPTGIMYVPMNCPYQCINKISLYYVLCFVLHKYWYSWQRLRSPILSLQFIRHLKCTWNTHGVSSSSVS